MKYHSCYIFQAKFRLCHQKVFLGKEICMLFCCVSKINISKLQYDAQPTMMCGNLFRTEECMMYGDYAA